MNHKNAFTCRLFEQMFLVLYHLLLKLIFVYFSLLESHTVSNFSMYPLYSTCVNNEKNHAFISAKMLTWDLKFVSLVISLLQGPESKHGGPWERRSERGGFNSKLKPKFFFKYEIPETYATTMSGMVVLTVIDLILAQKSSEL